MKQPRDWRGRWVKVVPYKHENNILVISRIQYRVAPSRVRFPGILGILLFGVAKPRNIQPHVYEVHIGGSKERLLSVPSLHAPSRGEAG